MKGEAAVGRGVCAVGLQALEALARGFAPLLATGRNTFRQRSERTTTDGILYTVEIRVSRLYKGAPVTSFQESPASDHLLLVDSALWMGASWRTRIITKVI
jgi:hypothetical protein